LSLKSILLALAAAAALLGAAAIGVPQSRGEAGHAAKDAPATGAPVAGV